MKNAFHQRVKALLYTRAIGYAHNMGSMIAKRRWHIFVLILLTLAMVLPGIASLPVIDRDEARFAQASVQMADTNDLLNIKFQAEARNKKPAAAYWAQTAMIKTFANDGENRIWAQRIPSALAAVLTILALYWGSLRLIGRKAGLIACALMATSLIFIFEGHIAKTDALLCASTTVMFASLGRLRFSEEQTKGQLEIWTFWIALGLSIMVKGPIGPALACLSLLSLWIWERDLTWARPLLHWGAIGVFTLIWLPWAIAIFAATDGAFFASSLGEDFGGKIVSGQESHGAPPGSHSLAIWMTLWPASLFLLPMIAFAVNSIRTNVNESTGRALRFALCWALPFWCLIEIMPTKLPHYGLPIFPALCLVMGAMILAVSEGRAPLKMRKLSAGLFALSTALILAVLITAQNLYGGTVSPLMTYIVCAATGGSAFIAARAIWRENIRLSFGAALVSSILLSIGTYSTILPNLTAFKTSERVVAALEEFAPGLDSRAIRSPQYTEPSLVYHAGTLIDVKAGDVNLSNGNVVILNMLRLETEDQITKLKQTAQNRGVCVKISDPVDGFNYSKGDPVKLVILKEAPCAAPAP